MTDFHSHVLPYIDDGADSNETAISMLKLSKRQNVSTVIATPHYLSDTMNADNAVSVREESYGELCEYARQTGFEMPEVIRGFEVTVHKKLYETDISRLCMGRGRVILLEMPYGGWTDEHFEILEYVRAEGYTVMLAHIERYLDAVPDDRFEQLVNMGFYNQVNSNAFIKPELRGFIAEMIKGGFVHVIGSDAHNMTTRCSLMDAAENYIKNKIGMKYYEAIAENERELLLEIR